MTRPLPHRYKNLPPEVSLDYRMSPENLWAFWVKTSPSYEELGAVLQGIVLATPGPKGIDEINKAEGGKLIGALTLAQLRQITEDIKSVRPTFQSKLPAWLGGVDHYLVLFEKEGMLQTSVTESHSVQESHIQVLENHPSADIKWATTTKLLEDLLSKMEQVLESEDYVKVNFDRRPAEPGHEWDWFEFMQRPDSYPKAKEAREYFAANPEAWKEARLRNLAEADGDISSIGTN